MDKSAVEASPESINSVFRSNFLPSLKWESIRNYIALAFSREYVYVAFFETG
jgi:hypothetical protein